MIKKKKIKNLRKIKICTYNWFTVFVETSSENVIDVFDEIIISLVALNLNVQTDFFIIIFFFNLSKQL